MASGWLSEGPGFELGRLQATFYSGLPKTAKKYSQPYSSPLMINFARRTSKDRKNLFFGFHRVIILVIL